MQFKSRMHRIPPRHAAPARSATVESGTFSDPSTPSAGSGFSYLVKPDCSLASCSTPHSSMADGRYRSSP